MRFSGLAHDDARLVMTKLEVEVEGTSLNLLGL